MDKIELTEKQIQASVIEFLQLSGFLTMRVNSGAARMKNPGSNKERFVRFIMWAALGIPTNSRGVSDVLAISPKGKFYAFEIKDYKGKASKDQRIFMNALTTRGVTAIVVRSLDTVIDLVNKEIPTTLL